MMAHRRNANSSMTSLVLLLVLLSVSIHGFAPSARIHQKSVNINSPPLQLSHPAFSLVPRKTIVPLHMSKTDKELACITNVSDNKYDALSEFIRQWASLFQSGGAQGMRYALTTPVTVTVSNVKPSGNVEKVSGVKILFQKTKTGDAYKSKEEERAVEEGEEEEKPEKNVSEGGVEVLVEQLRDGKVQVRARRCEVEEDTIIKEMSEETITNELGKAIETFNRQQVSSNEAKWGGAR